jgi:hypothetical protein
MEGQMVKQVVFLGLFIVRLIACSDEGGDSAGDLILPFAMQDYRKKCRPLSRHFFIEV